MGRRLPDVASIRLGPAMVNSRFGGIAVTSERGALTPASTGRCSLAACITLSRRVENYQRESTRRGRRGRADVLARSFVGRYKANWRILRSKPANPLGRSLAT